MVDSNELKNNTVYKLIVENNLKSNYNWDEV